LDRIARSRLALNREMRSSPRVRVRGLPQIVILSASWLVGVIYAYPGMMSMDSLDQLSEARAAYYTDGHPPAMAALWRLRQPVAPTSDDGSDLEPVTAAASST